MEKVIIKIRNMILIRSTLLNIAIKLFFINVLINPIYSNATEKSWQSDPEEFINFFTSKGITEILTSDDTEDIKAKEFRILFQKTFDINSISKFVIGRNWKNTSLSDQETFKRLFEDIIVVTWSRRFKDYDGQSIKVNTSSKDGDNGFLVNSFILDKKNGKFNVDWRLRKRQDGFKIVDIIVEGISMAITYRQDYNSVMRRKGGIKGLNKAIEKQLAKRNN